MPIMNADEIYDTVDHDARYRNYFRLLNAASTSAEKCDLTVKEFNALSSFLTYAQQDKDGRPLYAAVVDYLWMSWHIELNTKRAFLALLDE